MGSSGGKRSVRVSWARIGRALVGLGVIASAAGCNGETTGGSGGSAGSSQAGFGAGGTGGSAAGFGGSSGGVAGVGTGGNSGGVAGSSAAGSTGVAGSASCAGAGGAIDTSAEDAAIEAAFSGYADEYCPALEPCCLKDWNLYTRSGCGSYIYREMLWLQGQAEQQLAAGHHLSEASLKRCLEDRLAAARACDAARSPESCEHVWVGDKALGEPCADNDECAEVSGATVKCTNEDGADRCVAFTNVSAGEKCTHTSERPWPDTGSWFSGVIIKDYTERYCSVAAGNTCWGGDCVPISGQLGDSCQMFSCVSGLHCDKTAKCAPRPT
ncbi:MAG: hypothetical protein AB7S68_41280, partial [Polyangiaceae bacterium]